MEKSEIEMSDKFAFIAPPMHLVIKSNFQGYRLSLKALEELNKNSFGTSMYTVKYNKEIIWVSISEFKKYNFIEVEVPVEYPI